MKPTTAECIEWLTKWLEQYSQMVPPDNKAFVIQTAIHAQLIAAQEMAKALENGAKTFRWYEQLHAAKPDLEKAKRNAEFAEEQEKALAAWFEAGEQ